MTDLYGGMEGGGTKFVCAVGDGVGNIFQEITFPSTSPDETLGNVISFFKRYELKAIGLASFGPLDLNPASPAYGSITSTPKAGWSGINVLSIIKTEFHLPLIIDLDVNAAAFGEIQANPKRDQPDPFVYYTIGTGIGAGVIMDGKIIHGLTHPEAGHIRIPHDKSFDPFPGICPFHGDCFEGLASGPAISSRWQQSSAELPDDHQAWDLEASYIALALVNTILIMSPKKITLGGGVMNRSGLFPLIRQKVKVLLNQYISSPVLWGSMDQFITQPLLGKRSGVLGSLAMARLLTN